MQAQVKSQVQYPLPQPQWLKIFAGIISYIFHPLFIALYVAAYHIFIHPYDFAAYSEKQKTIRLISIFVITGFFPAFTVFLLWRLKFAASIYLRTQKERIIPYVSSIIYFFWAFYVSKNLDGTPPTMTAFFLGTFLAVSAALMANNYFKISMHAVAISGGAAFMILFGLYSSVQMNLPISIAVIIAGLVCTSRLIVSDHHPMEIYWGIIIGTICQVAGFYFIV